MTIQIHAPQAIYVGLVMLCLAEAFARNGNPKLGRHSFPRTLLGEMLLLALLVWGGFFG